MQLHEAVDAGPVGRELGAQVGAALLRLAHLAREPLDRLLVELLGLDHHALLVERLGVGGHRAGRRAADVGVVGAVGGEADQLLAGEGGRDDRDVGQVGAARVGVVEHPAHPGLVVLVRHRRDRGGHRAQVDRDVLGLHHEVAGGVEQRAGGVAALLDVGRVAGADQHRAHLLAGRAQRAGGDAQGDGIEAHFCTRIVPDSSTSPLQPGGTARVASRSSTIAGPSMRSPGAGSPRMISVSP